MADAPYDPEKQIRLYPAYDRPQEEAAPAMDQSEWDRHVRSHYGRKFKDNEILLDGLPETMPRLDQLRPDSYSADYGQDRPALSDFFGAALTDAKPRLAVQQGDYDLSMNPYLDSPEKTAYRDLAQSQQMMMNRAGNTPVEAMAAAQAARQEQVDAAQNQYASAAASQRGAYDPAMARQLNYAQSGVQQQMAAGQQTAMNNAYLGALGLQAQQYGDISGLAQQRFGQEAGMEASQMANQRAVNQLMEKYIGQGMSYDQAMFEAQNEWDRKRLEDVTRDETLKAELLAKERAIKGGAMGGGDVAGGIRNASVAALGEIERQMNSYSGGEDDDIEVIGEDYDNY